MDYRRRLRHQVLLAGLAFFLATGPNHAQSPERGMPGAVASRCPNNPYSQRLDCSDGVIRPETTGPGGIIVRRPGAPLPPIQLPQGPSGMTNEIRGFTR